MALKSKPYFMVIADTSGSLPTNVGTPTSCGFGTTRGAHLRCTDTFDIAFGQPFDYGLALSVFTHIPLNSILQALTNIAKYFAEGGCFYATYFPGPVGPERFAPITHSSFEGHGRVTTYAEANPYHYAFDDFTQLCAHLPLRVESIGDWAHPRGQHMLRFTRTS